MVHKATTATIVLAALTLGAGGARALTMQECSVKYKDAKATNQQLNWNDFRKSSCAGNGETPPSEAPKAAVQQSGEDIDVKYFGRLNLKTFACTDVSRSSLVNRACYDKAQQFMVVQLKATYYPYCEMPASVYEAFLAADSMGKFYNANIKGSGGDGPYDCRTKRKPTY